MKRYCQFLVMSTGYVEGTIPPEFKEEYKQPIDMVGTDGVFKLDARIWIHGQINDCFQRYHQLKNVHEIVGFKIIEASNFREEGKLIYKHIF